MAPASARRRSRSQTESDQDGDSDRYGSPGQASDTPKRQRMDDDESGSDTPAAQPNSRSRPAAAMTNGASADEFQPGAIVRVSVENFVTYEKADFFPGPHLNMVLGPNGTGKSSLVCAICLGLGYSPKHLGRAGSVKEFVKHGKDIATIEIELKRGGGARTNHIVRVQIRREQNSQKWWLNGKEASHKAVQALMRSLKIQVDNLCQFLPQDRVVEFAACTPVDLLHETIRAAAPAKMLEWQKELRDLHKDKKGLAEGVEADADTLRNLESRQQGLQADVDRIREREEIQERAANLKGALVIAKYQQAREKHAKARERKKDAERALKRLEEESGPSLEAVNEKQRYAKQIDAAVAGRSEALSAAQNDTDALAQDISQESDHLMSFRVKVDVEKARFDTKKREVATSRSRITGYQADLRNRPPEFNAADWNQKIRAEEHTQRELEAEQRQITLQDTEIREKAKGIVQEVRKIEADIEALDTQQGQQKSFMKKHFPEVARGWDWIQENQGVFEKEVFGPPMISCSLKDDRYSSQIQSLLQRDDFTCFTAQTKGDYKKLTDQLYRVMSLSIVVRSCSQPFDSFKSPVSRDEAVSLGLDGFAVDFMDGPAPVLAMLCAEKRLHVSGVSLRDQSDAEYDRLVNNGKVNQWAAGRQSFTVRRRREYGPQAMTTITKNIQKGQFWDSQPMDAQERAELDRRLVDLRGEREVLKEEHVGFQKKTEGIEQQKVEIMEKIEQLRREKNGFQKDHQKWQSLPEKIESEERNKAASEQAMQDCRQAMQEIHFEWDNATVKRAKLVLRHKDALEKIRDALHAFQEARIRLIEGRSDVQGLKDRNATIMQHLDQEKDKLQAAVDEANRTKEEGRRLSDDVCDLLNNNEDMRDTYTGLAEGRGPDDLVREIDAEMANLELIHAANPNVIREFERRAQEIAKLQRKMASVNEKLAGLDTQLQEIMGLWEPRLDELVAKINDAFAYNFEQISCAGEVRVNKEGDFDQWALDIMVRFRENETLQKLTAHRQSGGERAVSTIFFLMALQSMAQSPFRVVDEINQGMDPRNERMVHERMVEIACREHTSQYFLITPKLLTGLRYDRKMRVLCIASGEHMPREGRKLDFAKCLAAQKTLMVRARG